MSSVTFQAAATCALSLGLAVWIILRRQRSVLYWHIIALLGTLALWSGGAVWRYSTPDPEGVGRAVLFMWLGIATLPPAWLLLAARYARVQVVEERPAIYGWVFLPSLVTCLALLTNDHHGLFFTEIGRYQNARGPLFWIFLGWSYLLILTGIGLYLGVAGRMMTRKARGSGLLLASIAVVPAAANAIFVFRTVTLSYDPTPSLLGISVALFIIGFFRYDLLETLPLARRDVIEHLPDAVVIADEDDHIIDANPATEHILGISGSRLRGQRLDQVVAGLGKEAAESVGPLRESVFERGSARVEVLTRDGRYLELTAARVRGRHGEPAGWFAMLRDRTDARRYEHFVQRGQRLESVANLSAGIAHEVNNPLAFLRSNLGQLRHLGELAEARLDAFEPKQADELREHTQIVDECIDGIDRIGGIVGNLRRFSRAPCDERTTVDVNAAVGDAVKLADLHRSGGVAVETHLAEDLPRLEGSAERLVQAFLNLLLNAKQALAGRADGLIIVETRRADDRVEVRISDNGPGVPVEIQDRIFDPFFTTKTPDEGTGLGLSIALEIAREHGGPLEVVSRPGEGACFVVHLATAVPD
jgi:PAS domain S-box-containing protein